LIKDNKWLLAKLQTMVN